MIQRLSILVLLAAPWWATAAHAAESYDNCTGFIDTLPASISTQGTWCLRKHLYTSASSGPAISVLADNVTIDCNDYRLSGFGAGLATEAVGINTGPSRRNATVRQCRIQGFKYGVVLHGGNHLVEDNRFEGNTYVGIYTNGEANVVRDNRVGDTGGRQDAGTAIGISATGARAKVLDNTVSGVIADFKSGGAFPTGIYIDSGLVSDNRVTGLAITGGGDIYGLLTGIRMFVRGTARDNTVTQTYNTNGFGIRGNSGSTSICRDNDIQGFPYLPGVDSCAPSGNALQ
ncbi:MAG TPA: right-handed parallel beta-helix repeat-containing protein [Lysobacter sp.]